MRAHSLHYCLHECDSLAYAARHSDLVFVQSAKLLSLDLLKELAGEAEALPNRKKTKFLADGVQPQAAVVFQMLGQMLQASMPHAG